MIALILRELRIAVTGGHALLAVIFFLLVATLFPFAIGPDSAMLQRTGAGALWIAALLAALLPIERLVEPDRASGMLDQLAVRGQSDEKVALAKLAGHWLGFGPPLMLAALPAAALMKLQPDALLRLELGLLAGTPGLAALTLMVAAILAGLRSSGALAGLLMLPLAVPILIFGAGLGEGRDPSALKLLAAASLLMVALAPFVAGAAIRASRD
jgi:heme exporter protein B